MPWTPLLTTNVPAMPFDFVDYDVKLSEKPQKYCRVRQPQAVAWAGTARIAVRSWSAIVRPCRS